MFESLWTAADLPAGRLLLADDEAALVSVCADENGDQSGPRSETAIWGAGETNSLAVVLRAMFTWRLRNGDGGER